MKTTKLKVARFFPLLLLLALSPLALWSCTDAGDEPGGPTGPTTVYNPDIDYPGATIDFAPATVRVSAGETFTVVATYRDANGHPITNAPLEIVSELFLYLSTTVNPTHTDVSGKTSIVISVDPSCPPGSYIIEVGTYPAGPLDGPAVSGFFGIEVN